MDKRLIAFLIVLPLLFPLSASPDNAHGRLVIVIVFDGYNPIYNGNLTGLNALASQYGYSVPLEVQYPSVTIVSHMVFASGLLPNVTNICNTHMIDYEKMLSERPNVQNAIISRDDVLNTSTIYTEALSKGYLTALVTAKSKLLELLGPQGSATVLAQYPNYIQYDSVSSLIETNNRLMNKTQEIVASRISAIQAGQRGYILVNLPGTDYIGHNYGPLSEEYKTVLMNEYEITMSFLNRLKEQSIRDRTLVIILGDHSMQAVSENAATTDTTTGMLIIPELAVAGITHVAIASSGQSAFVYLYDNSTEKISQAVSVLRDSGKIDGVRTSVPVAGANGTLAEIGLNTPYAGQLFVSFKPPYYFADGTLKGAHGGYTTKITQARVLSGRTDALKRVDELTSIDVAALSFGFLDLEPIGLGDPSKLLQPRVFSEVSAMMPAFVSTSENLEIVVEYSLPRGIDGSVKVTVYDASNKEVASKEVSISGSGVVKINLGKLPEGSYKIVVSLYYGDEEVSGKVYSVAVQKEISTEVKQPVGYMLLSLALLIAIIALAFYIPKRL